MPFSYDKDVGAALEMMKGFSAKMGVPLTFEGIPAGDVETRRALFEKMMSMMPASGLSVPENIEIKDFTATAPDGYEVPLRWISLKKSGESEEQKPGPVVLHVHGGGMILGSVALSTPPTIAQVTATSVPVLMVDYRLAPENPHPTPLNDVYAGLTWLQEHAAELSVDPARIGVLGESSGGGIAAAAVLMARDKKLSPPIARQMLWQPMLDDRNTVADEHIAPFAFWTYDGTYSAIYTICLFDLTVLIDNKTGWGALLGDKAGTDDVDYYGSPARATDLSGLPDTYLEVGQLDVFLYDTIDYARNLSKGGVNVELHVYPGCCHTFNIVSRDGQTTKRAMDNRYTYVKSI